MEHFVYHVAVGTVHIYGQRQGNQANTVTNLKGERIMEPLRLSPNEALTLLSGLGAFIWVIKVFCIKWQNERLRQVNKQLRRELR